MDNAMEVLDRRLRTIERKVYGSDYRSSSQTQMEYMCVPKLTDMARSLGNAIEKRDRIAPVVRKVNDLEILIDPTIGSELTGLTADCVADLIVSNENKLRQTHNLLETFHEKKTCLNSDALTDVASLEGKLAQLAKIHVDQEERAGVLSEESLSLVGQYNEIIDTISKAFISYDQIVKKHEDLANAKNA